MENTLEIKWAKEYFDKNKKDLFKNFNIVDAILFQYHHIHHFKRSDRDKLSKKHDVHHCPVCRINHHLAGKNGEKSYYTKDECKIKHCKCAKHHVINAKFGTCVTNDENMEPIMILFEFMEECPDSKYETNDNPFYGTKAYHIESAKVIKVFR